MEEADIGAFPSAEIRASRVTFGGISLVLTAVTVGLAAVGWLLPAILTAVYAGWAGFRMVAAPVRLRVTEAGVEDRSFWYSAGLIPWSEILEVREGRWGSIEIDLRDETSHWDQLGPFKGLPRVKLQLFYGLGPAAILPWVLRGSRTEILDALQEGLDTVVLRSFAEGRLVDPADPEAV